MGIYCLVLEHCNGRQKLGGIEDPMLDTSNDVFCECGTSWQKAFEDVYPEAVEKFHKENHDRWKDAMYERHKQIANTLFNLSPDTEWTSK
jgi:hypothetical protein